MHATEEIPASGFADAPGGLAISTAHRGVQRQAGLDGWAPGSCGLGRDEASLALAGGLGS